VEGPYVSVGARRGAFAWWGITTQLEEKERAWYAGSWLLP
jgi:hypothetical protein